MAFLIFSHGPALAQGPLVFETSAAKDHCSREWPDDFSMQEYCFQKIENGFENFKGLSESESDPVMAEAFENCRREWVVDWGMVHYCAEQQMEGRETLPDLLSGLPSEVADVIREKCRTEWPADFSMRAYCVQQNSASWKRMNQ